MTGVLRGLYLRQCPRWMASAGCKANMLFGINTLDDIEVKGKTVLCRVDMSEPVDWDTGDLKDNTRIRVCVPTIRELSDKGARVVVMSHQGGADDYGNYYTTAPHAKVLTHMLEREVHFVDAVCSASAREAIAAMADGDVVLLDNVRYMAEETTLFEQKFHLTPEQQAKTRLVRRLAPMADLYVCDAFSLAHMSQPTLCGFPQLLPSAMGRLTADELTVLTDLMENPARPSVFVLGGAKLEAALRLMSAVLERGIADQILVGGLVAQLLLWADGYEIGGPCRDRIREMGCEPLLDKAGELLDAYHEHIILPTDYGYVKIRDNVAERREAMLHALPPTALVSDIGSGTAALFRKIIFEAKTVFANGTMGMFEQDESEAGTRAVWEALGDTEAYTIIGGPDSIAAAVKYKVADKVNRISAGGDAVIHFLAGKELPVLTALRHGSTHRP